MEGWDVALLVVVGYVAVTTLVALMLRRRDRLWADFLEKLAAEERRKQSEQQKNEPRVARRRDKAA